VLGVEQSAPPQQHLAGLPDGEGEHAETDGPQQHRAAGTVGDRLQGAGLIGVGTPQTPGQPDRQVADQEVHDAVGDQPHPGDVGQDRVVGDLTGPVDDALRPVPEGSGTPHPQVRSG
jgi:hypothetical protein